MPAILGPGSLTIVAPILRGFPVCLPDRRSRARGAAREQIDSKGDSSMSTAVAPAVDMNKLNAFIGQFVADLGAAAHAGMVVIGEKLGLYKALAGAPLNSAELAAKTSTDERYLREWLASQAAGGYITYEGKNRKVSL